MQLNKTLEQQKEHIYIYGKYNVALLAYKPQEVGHTVIMPYKKSKNLSDLSTTERNEVFKLIKKCKQKLNEVFNYINFIVLINEGSLIQSVPYFHLHIIPLIEKSKLSKYYAGIEEVNNKKMNLIEIAERLK